MLLFVGTSTCEGRGVKSDCVVLSRLLIGKLGGEVGLRM